MTISAVQDIKFWYCSKGTSNKIWGHFLHGDQHWVFWGAVGANWTFKNHGVITSFEIDKLARSKENKNYIKVDSTYVNNLDPLWETRFEERFVFFSLAWG